MVVAEGFGKVGGVKRDSKRRNPTIDVIAVAS